MGTIRKLRRKSHTTKYRTEPLGHGQSSFPRKMSEVLLDFADPLLNTIDDDDGEFFEEVLMFACLCWNLSLLQEKEQKKMALSIVDEMGKSDPLKRLGVEKDIWMLLERKKDFFANDKRMVLDYKFIEEQGRPRLLVVSTLVKD